MVMIRNVMNEKTLRKRKTFHVISLKGIQGNDVSDAQY